MGSRVGVDSVDGTALMGNGWAVGCKGGNVGCGALGGGSGAARDFYGSCGETPQPARRETCGPHDMCDRRFIPP